MKKFVVALVILLALHACTFKYPETIVGVTMTCATDSTPFVVDTIIRFKAAIVSKSNPHPIEFKYKHMECDNKPVYFDFLPHYPSNIILDFKEKEYKFGFSFKPAYPTIKYGENGFAVKVNFDLGKMDYSAKKRTITLTSTINKWARTFKYSYNKRDKILTLRSEAVK